MTWESWPEYEMPIFRYWNQQHEKDRWRLGSVGSRGWGLENPTQSQAGSPDVRRAGEAGDGLLSFASPPNHMLRLKDPISGGTTREHGVWPYVAAVGSTAGISLQGEPAIRQQGMQGTADSSYGTFRLCSAFWLKPLSAQAAPCLRLSSVGVQAPGHFCLGQDTSHAQSWSSWLDWAGLWVCSMVWALCAILLVSPTLSQQSI